VCLSARAETTCHEFWRVATSGVDLLEDPTKSPVLAESYAGALHVLLVLQRRYARRMRRRFIPKEAATLLAGAPRQAFVTVRKSF